MTDALNWATAPVKALRREYAQKRKAHEAFLPRDVQIVSDPLGLRFHPKQIRSDATVLYFHGGGWITGSPETHKALCAWLAHSWSLPVLSVRYGLAPEHRYPRQREEARAALASTPGQIILAGDSAGVPMALWAEDAAPTRVVAISGFYSAFGLTDSESLRRLGPQSDGLTAAAMSRFYRDLGCPPDRLLENVTSGTAPILLMKAGADPLADDTDHGARILRAKGRKVDVFDAPGATHGFLHDAGENPEIRRKMTTMSLWLHEKLPLQADKQGKGRAE